jgi:hypothetical protein
MVRWTDENKAILKDLYLRGKSLKVIGKYFGGASASSINKALDRFGVRLRRNKKGKISLPKRVGIPKTQQKPFSKRSQGSYFPVDRWTTLREAVAWYNTEGGEGIISDIGNNLYGIGSKQMTSFQTLMSINELRFRMRLPKFLVEGVTRDEN